MNIYIYTELDSESGLQCFQEQGELLEFAIEKRSGGSFLVKEKYY
jgi:hypothetical protein